MRKSTKRWLIINLICIVFFAAGAVSLSMYVKYSNGHRFVYEMGEEDAPVTLTMNYTKHWSEDVHGYRYGVEYDGVIDNQGNKDLMDWVAHIEIPAGCVIDSSWNGDFLLEDNVITVTAAEYTKDIPAGQQRNFGFVLYTETLKIIQDYDLLYYKHFSLREQPGFWMLLILFGVLIVVDITAVGFAYKTKRLEAQKEEYVNIVNQSFLTFARMIDAKDSYTQGHSHRVALYCREIGRRMGFSAEKCQQLFYVALLHDIGKIGVPDDILKKTGKLNWEERQQIEQHVIDGGDILQHFTAIEGIENGARYHHERYDGTGYAARLKGKDIPLIARIIGVADAFDAMTSMRCYRPKLPMEIVRRELSENAGTQFDPEIVPYLMAMIDEGVAPVDLTGEDLIYELQGKNKKGTDQEKS